MEQKAPNQHQNSKGSPTPAAQSLKTLAGVVERITFQSAETGYTVARLLPDYSGPRPKSVSGSGSGSSSNDTTSSSSSASSLPQSANTFGSSSRPPSSVPTQAQRSFFKQAKGDDNLVTIVGTLTGV